LITATYRTWSSTSLNQSGRFNTPRLAPIRRTDNPIALHHIQNARRASVPQPQMPLQRGSRRFPHLQHHAHGFLVHGILVARRHLAFARALFIRRRRNQVRLVVPRRGLALP